MNKELERWIPFKTFFNHKKMSLFNEPLIKPCTNLNVCDYEKKLGFVIPDELAYYLQYVSTEFILSNVPYVFQFNHCTTSCTIPLENTSATLQYLDKVSSKITYNCFDGMVQIGTFNCKSNIYIVLKGNHRGSIWKGNDSSVHKIFDDLIIYLTYLSQNNYN